MKKFLIAAVLALVGATGAQAADLGPVYRKAAPIVAPFTWTGSYIGGYVGGASAAEDGSTSNPVTATGGFFNFNPVNTGYGLGSSFIGGYTSGYNYQFAPNWVIGYEGEIGYVKINGSGVQNPPGVSNGLNDTNGITRIGDWYSVYTARLGYAWDRSLIYVKGGAAVVRVEAGISDRTGVPQLDTIQHKWKIGYAVGGGWEYAFDPKWSLKAEYLYLGIESDYATSGNLRPAGPQFFTTTRVPGIHTGKIGLNYRFDWFSLLR
ncbi:MAG: outer membrane beta-barrel protein [Afipia sp.]|nr:outer membrane beta-barrel protein [Afipia sp.]